jgi:hypothetical protein
MMPDSDTGAGDRRRTHCTKCALLAGGAFTRKSQNVVDAKSVHISLHDRDQPRRNATYMVQFDVSHVVENKINILFLTI